jgi:prepilin-type N-terminal cleavage/methylation domain-containing protein
MPSIILARRRGMTLVELLVVVMILGLLSVTVLPTIGNTVGSRRNREAARNASSFIARAQSRAINAIGPRGFMIQPLAADPAAAIDMYFASAPEHYGGEDDDSRAVVKPADLNSRLESQLDVHFERAGIPDAPTLDRLKDTDFCADGDAIQFGGFGPWYRLVVTPLRDGSGPPAITMWADASQSPRNLSWPRTGIGGLPFRISRQPRRASSGVLQLQKGAAVDVAWSCLGSHHP